MQRAEHDQEIKTQDETQRQLNDCLAFKLSKQTEHELGQRIDEINAQITDVSTRFAANLSTTRYSTCSKRYM